MSNEVVGIIQGFLQISHGLYETYTDQKPENSPYGECNGIKQCKSLKRLLQQLPVQDKYNENDFDIENTNYCSLINDFHHILSFHHNAFESEYIYNFIFKRNNLFCDVSKCKIHARNNRMRENDSENRNKYIEIMDIVHEYFMHSYYGFNTINMNNNNHVTDDNKNQNSDTIYFDEQLSELQNYLKMRRQNFCDIRGDNRIQNNKFVTKIKASDENKDKQHDEKNNKKEYSFGYQAPYWSPPEYQGRPTPFQPKYKSMKEELMSNTIFRLNINVFNNALKKAMDLLNNSYQIKRIQANNSCADICGINIKKGAGLNTYNILSVLLYTDYDTLSYKFSSTFRPTLKDAMGRNIEYGNWCKCLIETVNAFGTEIHGLSFYHGISMMYFDKFLAWFYSPTSTTTKIAVAAVFARNDGLILELCQYEQSRISSVQDLKCFNCSLVSCFPEEHERLFIQRPCEFGYYADRKWHQLQFKTILNMKTNENYKFFIEALVSLEIIFAREKMTGKLTKKVSDEASNIINNLFDYSLKNSSNINNDYISQLFQNWTRKIDMIHIFRSNVKKYFCDLKIWSENKVPNKIYGYTIYDNLVKYHEINQIFKNVTSIEFRDIGTVNVSYLKATLSTLKAIQNLKYSKLRKIRLYDVQIMYLNTDFSAYQQFYRKIGWEIKEVKMGQSRLIREKFGYLHDYIMDIRMCIRIKNLNQYFMS
eukprot:378773_1